MIDGSLLKQDFKAGQVAAATNIVVRRQDVVPAAAPASSIKSVGCNAGEKLVGGGVVRVHNDGAWSSASGDAVQMSAPASLAGVPSGEDETPGKWLSALAYTSTFAGDRIRHYALCARP